VVDNRNKMITMGRVAERAGVSIATVSKVLSNTPYFTEETRQKVMNAVEELGYVPNLAARALSTGKTHIIGVVFPLINDTIFADPFMLYMLAGVEAACREHGYNMLMSTPRLQNNRFDLQYHQLIQSGYMDGLIALDNVPSSSVIRPALEHGLPAVGIGYHDNPYYIRSDDVEGGRQLMAHVLEHGHRRIGIIGVSKTLSLSLERRIEGLQQAVEATGLRLSDMPLVEGNFSIESGASCVRDLLTHHPDLTAIICLNDRMAMGAIQEARSMGRHIPDDLTIVGYDDIPSAAVFYPPLTTINQHAPQIGKAAATMLFDLMQGKNPISSSISPGLMVRQSSAAAR
jgi:LacI family transcriptional regulator